MKIAPTQNWLWKLLWFWERFHKQIIRTKKLKLDNHTQEKKTKNLCDLALGLCPCVVDNEIIVSKKDYKVFTKLKSA